MDCANRAAIPVIPAKAGIQTKDVNILPLDPRLRGGDVFNSAIPRQRTEGAQSYKEINGAITVPKNAILKNLP